MNHRESFNRVMSGGACASVPNYELGCWPQTVERWRAEGLPADSTVGKMDMFDGEPLFGLSTRAFARLGLGMRPGFQTEVLEETERYLTVRHGNGVVTKALKEGSIGASRMCMDAYIDFPVKDRQTWLDVKRRYDPADPSRYPADWEAKTAEWRDRDYPVCLLGNGSFGLYSQLRSWVGTENISYMFYDAPALVEEMLEFLTDFVLDLVEPALGAVDFDYFNFFEDCAGKSRPIYGPEIFEKFFARPYRRIIDRLGRAGIRSIWVDSDGDPEVLVSHWMDCGVNCFWPLEQASGMDPRRLRRKYGNALVLCGGIDKRALAQGKDAIRTELEAKIPPMLESGGFIPHIDHTVPPDVSYEDFMFYMDVKRSMIGS